MIAESGEGGIRTREAYRLHAFQACALGHYATSPDGKDYSMSNGGDKTRRAIQLGRNHGLVTARCSAQNNEGD